MRLFDTLKRPPVGPIICCTIVVVEAGAIVAHFYLHKPIELEADHRAGLVAEQPRILPDNDHPHRAPPAPPGRLAAQTTSTSLNIDINPIWFIPGGWPPSST